MDEKGQRVCVCHDKKLERYLKFQLPVKHAVMIVTDVSPTCNNIDNFQRINNDETTLVI